MRAPVLSLKGRALRYLSQREHSRFELRRKLAKHAQEDDDVDALLDFLEKNNWLSQERFAESLVNRKASRYGDSRVMAELKSHGLTSEALVDIKAGLSDSETARAIEVWQRKFGVVAPDAAARAKQMRFLLQRGFSQRAARVAMQGSPDDDEFHDD